MCLQSPGTGVTHRACPQDLQDQPGTPSALGTSLVALGTSQAELWPWVLRQVGLQGTSLPPKPPQGIVEKGPQKFTLSFTKEKDSLDFFLQRSFGLFLCYFKQFFFFLPVHLEGQQLILGRKMESSIRISNQSSNRNFCVST